MSDVSPSKVRWARYRYKDAFKTWKVPEADERWLIDVCLRPDDALPRLIYADWLEEQRRPAAAAFWREVSKHPVRVPLRWPVPTTCHDELIWNSWSNGAGERRPTRATGAVGGQWRRRQPGGRCAWLNYAAAVTWQACRFDLTHLALPVPRSETLTKRIGEAVSLAVVGPHVVRELGGAADLDVMIATGADTPLGTDDFDRVIRTDAGGIPDMVIYRGRPSGEYYRWRNLPTPAHGIVAAVEYPTTLDAFMDMAVAYSEADFNEADPQPPDEDAFTDAYIEDCDTDEADLDDPDDLPELPPLDWSKTDEGH